MAVFAFLGRKRSIFFLWYKTVKHKKGIIAMKVTKYWHAYPLDDKGQMLLYNAFTNALARIEPEKYQQFINFAKAQTPIDDSELKKQLTMGGFLLEDNVDELALLRLRLHSTRYDSTSFGLTLAPTMDCNFRCVYCYESKVIHHTYMGVEVQEAVVKLLEERAKHIRNFSVTWYGGEPLLAFETILRLSKRFIEICEKNDITYTAGIITNGYLLTREKAEMLAAAKVTFYQITIDGTRESHDASRPLKNGAGTYDKIFDNLVQCADLLTNVSMRVNVGHNNVQAVDSIFEKLEESGLSDHVVPYLGKITNDNGDPELEPICFTTSEFAKLDLQYTFSHSSHLDWFGKYPTLKGNYCGADCYQAMVIDPDGFIYRCWNEIGNHSYAVANLLRSTPDSLSLYFDYMLFDPTTDPQCSHCDVLPLCMGGCPYYRVHDRQENRCSVYRTELQEYLTAVAHKLLEEKKSAGCSD